MKKDTNNKILTIIYSDEDKYQLKELLEDL